jgi:hypothetical protein
LDAHAKDVHFFTTIEPRNSEFNFPIELVHTPYLDDRLHFYPISSNLITTRNKGKTRDRTVTFSSLKGGLCYSSFGVTHFEHALVSDSHVHVIHIVPRISVWRTMALHVARCTSHSAIAANAMAFVLIVTFVIARTSILLLD